MAKLKAQGTQLYFIDPDSGEVVEVPCVTSLSGLDASVDEIETTCLNDTARTYEAGLATPGTATIGIQFDPADPSNVRLYELYLSRTRLDWVAGLSDGVAPPTVDVVSGEWEFPSDRSWLAFDGYVSAFPWDFALNTVVSNNLSVRVSDQPQLVAKVEPTP